jgi:hypothetical protein
MPLENENFASHVFSPGKMRRNENPLASAVTNPRVGHRVRERVRGREGRHGKERIVCE